MKNSDLSRVQPIDECGPLPSPPEPEERFVVDHRACLTPSEMVGRKLASLLGATLHINPMDGLLSADRPQAVGRQPASRETVR